MTALHPAWKSLPLVVALLGSAAPAGAISTTVLDLGFYKSLTSLTATPFADGDLILADGFNNGDPALSDPRVDGGTNGYSFHGLLPGVTPVEAGGTLTVTADAAHSELTANATGDPRYSTGVRLLTATSNASVINSGPLAGRHGGLSRDTAWSVGADFVLTLPAAGENYGVRLTDYGIGSTATQGNDVLELRLLTVGGTPEVWLSRQDFLAGTGTVLARQTLAPLPADTVIGMGFAHVAADTDTIAAYYALSDGAPQLLGSGTVYTGEAFTRFELRASVPAVPEPPPQALLALGLAALAAWRAHGRRAG